MLSPDKQESLVAAVSVVAELTGTELSIDAMRAMVDVLKDYPEKWTA